MPIYMRVALVMVLRCFGFHYSNVRVFLEFFMNLIKSNQHQGAWCCNSLQLECVRGQHCSVNSFIKDKFIATCVRVGITKSQYYTVSSEHHYELVCYLAATEIFWCSFRGSKGSHWVWLEPQATAKERDGAGGLQCYERSETCCDSGDRDELLFLCGQD